MPIIPFSDTLTIPAGTTDLDCEQQLLAVVPGEVILLRLFVPPGPRGEVRLWFKHQQSQLAPAPPGTWNNLDDDIIEYPLRYPVGPGECEFHLCGSSPNALFSHAIEFELLVDTTPAASDTQTGLSLTNKLLGALGLGG